MSSTGLRSSSGKFGDIHTFNTPGVGVGGSGMKGVIVGVFVGSSMVGSELSGMLWVPSEVHALARSAMINTSKQMTIPW